MATAGTPATGVLFCPSTMSGSDSQQCKPLETCVYMTRDELLKYVEERIKLKGPPCDHFGTALTAEEYTDRRWMAKKHTSTMRQCAEVRYVTFEPNTWFSD